MDFNKYFQSKGFLAITWIIATVIIVLVVFTVGMFIGYKKADFSYRWGENYHRNFAGPRGGFMINLGGFPGNDFIEAHGIFGQILKIDGSSLIVNDRGNTEKIVLIKDDTVINRQRENIKISDLKIDDYIVVIGNPNSEGQIEAKLIRIMPAPPTGAPNPLPASR